jgi:hypothetical protein
MVMQTLRQTFLAIGILLLWLNREEAHAAWAFPDSNLCGALACKTTSPACPVNEGMFLTIGDHGTILSSRDGVAWLPRTSESVTNGQAVACGNDVMVRIVSSFGIETSTDGLRWTSRCSGIPNRLHAVAFGNGLFVAVGNEGALVSSADGVKWTTRASRTDERLRGVAFNGNHFVVVGYEGTVLVSKNGRRWRPCRSGTQERLLDVAYGNGVFVAVGWNGVILSSENGLFWTRRISEITSHLRTVIFHTDPLQVTQPTHKGRPMEER